MTNQNLELNGSGTLIKRRQTTRSSGYKSHPDSTGGSFSIEKMPCYELQQGQSISIEFDFKDLNIKENNLVGFGGWFYVDNAKAIRISNRHVFQSRTYQLVSGDWHAFGSLGVENVKNCINNTQNPVFTFTALNNIIIAFYQLDCGIVEHEYMTKALQEKSVLFKNMYEFAPEANIIKEHGSVIVEKRVLEKEIKVPIYLKSCNRCARLLPINFPNERHHLSFSNHCVNKAPCTHTGFGLLTNIDTNEKLDLRYGFQLECRFCKKFAVNAALNHQRTANQMKEDSARRRGFELLLQYLFGESPQRTYRARNNGRELTADIWNKFDRKCFKCKTKLNSMNEMHLDHTRPLALLWPLDETATCLCASCNSQKRDKSPVDFYTTNELSDLARLTGIPLDELLVATINIEAIEKIIEKMEWLMKDFCRSEKLNQMRDGKHTAELFLKALQKVFDQTEYRDEYNDLISMYREFNNEDNDSSI